MTRHGTAIGADDADMNGASYEVGYRRPPVHSRFKPGQSGNPSGLAKGRRNFKTLFDKILNEQIALQDGLQSKKITKAEAINPSASAVVTRQRTSQFTRGHHLA